MKTTQRQMKRQTPWPLERAQMIRRHEQRIRDATALAKQQYATGVERGRAETMRDLALHEADRAKLVEHVYDYACDELARAAGAGLARHIDEKMRPFEIQLNTYDQMRRRILDAAMSTAILDARSIADRISGADPEVQMTILTVEFGKIPAYHIAVDPFKYLR